MSDNEPKLVLCMKWGDMYGPEYVNVLYGMVSRNLSYSFRLICFTDDETGVRPEVECFPLPELGVEVPPGAPGKWPKQALWAKDLFRLEGVALFLDLDSVILDSLDPYFEYGNDDDVITAKNWTKPWKRMAQTSVFRFKIGQHSYMLEQLRADPQLMVKYRFEQNYVSSNITGGVRFWPGPWTKHFGLHCMGCWPMRYVRMPRKPKGARIVTFPGSPKPPDSIRGAWHKESDARKPIEHLRWINEQRKAGKKWRKQLSRYVRPTPWVAEAWRE
ncbi:MAG: glycosyl transferase [Verrucomicrobia bacterium]|jgi:hypothetical protein|nr:glycosyl transferase [Verrucomicrobiota bacterium]